MSLSESEINGLVRKLSTQQKFQQGSWKTVIRLARKYAQLKVHGSYISVAGANITVNPNERTEQIEVYKDNLMRAIEIAYLEDSLVGALLYEC